MNRNRTLVAVIAEGLEHVGPGDRGFTREHYDAVRLANAAPALLAAVRRLLDPVPGETLDQVMTDLKMAAAKCEIGGTAL